MFLTLRLTAVVLCLSLAPCVGLAQDSDTVLSIAEFRVIGYRALEKRDALLASDVAERLLANYEKSPEAIRLAGDLYLRVGKVNSAVKQFERYVRLVPADKPELWQFGIALALVNRYDDARKLFELHRAANPNDVENSAWHFLCVAKMANQKAAEKTVLPAPGDTRVPMNEIRRLLIDGDEQRVLDAVSKLTEGSAEHAAASFYANLYLGLYADATGNSAKAKRFLSDAAKSTQVNYMADVARVYLRELDADTKP